MEQAQLPHFQQALQTIAIESFLTSYTAGSDKVEETP
jgi:hypothetical protein